MESIIRKIIKSEVHSGGFATDIVLERKNDGGTPTLRGRLFYEGVLVATTDPYKEADEKYVEGDLLDLIATARRQLILFGKKYLFREGTVFFAHFLVGVGFACLLYAVFWKLLLVTVFTSIVTFVLLTTFAYAYILWRR